MSERPVLLAAISDIHAGSRVSAMPKEVWVTDESRIIPNKFQRQLTGKIEEAIEWQRNRALELGSAGADRQGSVPQVLLHNGDATEGLKWRSEQIITSELAGPQIEVAVDILSMWCEGLEPVAVAFTRGTQSHVGKGSEWEEAVAKGIEDKGWNVKRAPSLPHKRTAKEHVMRLGGHLILAAHHGRIGRTPFTRSSNLDLKAGYFFAEESRLNWVLQQAGEDPQEIPRVLIGSHYHQLASSGRTWPTQWLQTGCWTLRNSFAHKVAAFSRESIGFWSIYCDPDERRPEPVEWEWIPRRDEPWTI